MIATPVSSKSNAITEIRPGLPTICGWEQEIAAIVNHDDPIFLPTTNLTLDNIVFAWCYSRMGDFIPELVAEGCNPRIMLDYSGNLLWGLVQMGRQDILDKLKLITCNSQYQPYVEWLGTMWSHAVAPSTPIPDLKLQMQAWQTYFASIFGPDALKRVKGFSPPEMHLPNHPDTLYEYIKALKECGYRWLLVQEHSVENLDGSGLSQEQKYIPNRLVGVWVPSLGSQIADGENGGVMMNEFPRDFPNPWREMQGGSSVAGFNGTEYLELIEAAGVNPQDYPPIQAVHQHKIWQRVNPDAATPEAVEQAIAELKQSDHRFSMDGASWTNDLSWVRGYENVLEPMNSFTRRPDYLEALLYNLLVQTSCFRYWGQGTWTDYARTLYARGAALTR